MPLSGAPYGYAGPPATEFIWTDLIYTAPTLIYTGAGKIYFVILISKGSSQRAYINDNTSGSTNKILEPWANGNAPTTVIPLFGAPIPFSTGLRISWMSGTESNLALKIGYTKD